MFGIGGFELFIIVVFAFVLFGPDKLPEVIKLAGHGIKKFKKAKAEMDKVLNEEIVDPVMKIVNEPDDNSKSSEKNNQSNKDNTTKQNTISNDSKLSDTDKTTKKDGVR